MLTAESTSALNIWLPSSQQCVGDKRCGCGAGSPGPELFRGDPAKACSVVGLQPAAALHTSHSATTGHTGGFTWTMPYKK